MGIPNHGWKYYSNFATEMFKLATNKKPFFVSVSGLSTEENLKILSKVKRNPDIHAVELNVSCPNIIGKPQLGYDPEGLSTFLDEVAKVWDISTPLGLKLPPYFDIAHFEAVSKVIKDHPMIQFITCCNSFGNGLVIDTETESVVIKPKNGFGGVGGAPMKATTLANVHKFYQLLGDPETSDSPIDIIGCGGICSGEDLFQLILAGAKVCQVGTQLAVHGTTVLEQYQTELTEIMEQKGYNSLKDFRGKLKYL